MAEPETFAFQAEINQLLSLIINTVSFRSTMYCKHLPCLLSQILTSSRVCAVLF